MMQIKADRPTNRYRLCRSGPEDMAIKTSSQDFAVAALLRSAANLPGGSFALVMATGIVSIAADQQGFHRLALALFVINAIAFALLAAGSLLRLAVSPAAMLGELVRHRTGASYLTIVAGTAILGDQIGLLTPDRPL